MRGKRRLIIGLSLALSLVLAACSGATTNPPAASTPTAGAPAPAAPKYGGLSKLELATAGAGGGFHVLGAALAPVLEKELGIPAIATTSEGSSENTALIERGEVPLGMITGSFMYEAWSGTGKAFKEKQQNGRLLFAFHPTNSFLFTRADSGITKMSELKGKRVGIGSSPSTWNFFTCPLIAAHGIKCPEEVTAVYGTLGDLATQVGDGTLDAAIGLETTPASYQLAQERALRVLAFDEQAVKYLNDEVWYYHAATMKPSQLPKDSWTQPEFKTVMWMGPYLVAKQDIPDDLAYDIVKAVHENLKQLNESSNIYRWALADPMVLTTPLGDMLWHPGAEQYWKEVGLWQGK